jgi:hypothetical protein
MLLMSRSTLPCLLGIRTSKTMISGDNKGSNTDRSYSLQCLSNGRFVSSEGIFTANLLKLFADGADGGMTCNRLSGDLAWERFKLVLLPNNLVALQGADGRYCSSEDGYRPMRCDRATVQDWEKFEKVENSDGSVSFRSMSGKFVSSEGSAELLDLSNCSDGRMPMTCNRDIADTWEKFRLV